MNASSRIVCPVCGRENQAGTKCSFCGTALSDPAGSEPDGAARGSPPTAPVPSSGQPEAPWRYPPTPTTSPAPWPQPPAPAYHFAGFWIRVLAYLVDSLLLQIVMLVLLAVGILGYFSGTDQEFTADALTSLYQLPWSYMATVSFIVGMVYFTLFLGSRGQTPGKMLFRLKVIRADGGELTYTQAALRTLGLYLTEFFTLSLGFLWVAVDPRKQGLHDKLAGTLEIRLGI